MQLKYEDLVEDPPSRINSVHNFLGVARQQPVSANITLKIAVGRLAAVIENLEEVREALRGTQWAAELDTGFRFET